jgi:hypothetical protein
MAPARELFDLSAWPSAPWAQPAACDHEKIAGVRCPKQALVVVPYWTSSGAVPVAWPLASVVILSTRASA